MESKTFEDIVLNKFKELISSLEEEWLQISLPTSYKAKRKLVLYNLISDVCDRVLSEERSENQKLIQRIEDNKKRLQTLCQELNETYEIPDDLNILEMDLFLDTKILSLKEEKQQKLESFQKLFMTNKDLATFLGENSPHFSNEELPTAEEFALIKKHIKELEEEKERRKQSYQNLRKDIVSFAQQLEKPLESKILLDIVCNSEQEHSLTKHYLLDVKKLHSDLEFEVQEMESQSDELRERISSLWGLLQVTEESKEAFLSTVPSHTPSSIIKMKEYFAELKNLRLQNMDHFIEDMRTELEKWWAKCYVGESQKNAFMPFLSASSLCLPEEKEEVLDTLEKEVNKWKTYYNDHSFILRKIDHFLALFDNMRQLEEKVKDPTRLFNTRGGALLQEEKERKKVKMELPLVEKQLINLCCQYEATNDKPFLIDGSSIEEYLCKLWDYYSIQREEEKKYQKPSQNKNKAKPAVSKGVKIQTSVTPASSRKRGRDVEDNLGSNSAKKLAKSPAHSCASRFNPSPLKIHQATSVVASRPLGERNRLVPPVWQPFCSDKNRRQNVISYENFKTTLEKLNSKEVIHSSVLCLEMCENVRFEPQNTPKRITPPNSPVRNAHLKRNLPLFSPSKKITPILR